MTKELKKKHPSRPLGGEETGNRDREDSRQGGSWKTRQSHICALINWEKQLGRERETAQPRVPAQGNKASKPLTIKTCGGCGDGRNSQPHRRVHWIDPQGPRPYTNPPTWESAPEEHNLLEGSRGSD